MIETDVRAYLVTLPAIMALVSTRVYVGWLPQNVTYPAVCITEFAYPPIVWRLALPRVQVSCHASTYTGAYAIADAVVAALDGFKGTMNGRVVDHIEFMNRNRLYDERAGMYHVPVEFKIKFRKQEV